MLGLVVLLLLGYEFNLKIWNGAERLAEVSARRATPSTWNLRLLISEMSSKFDINKVSMTQSCSREMWMDGIWDLSDKWLGDEREIFHCAILFCVRSLSRLAQHIHPYRHHSWSLNEKTWKCFQLSEIEERYRSRRVMGWMCIWIEHWTRKKRAETKMQSSRTNFFPFIELKAVLAVFAVSTRALKLSQNWRQIYLYNIFCIFLPRSEKNASSFACTNSIKYWQ